MSCGVIVVAPVGAETVTASWLTLAVTVPVAFPESPKGAVTETETPVTVEPEVESLTV